MLNTALDALRVLQQKNSSPVAMANLNGQDLLRPSHISMFQTPRIATPDSRIHPKPYSMMLTPSRANHELSPIETEIERAVNIENECRTSSSQAPCDRGFYVPVDLSADQEKVLLWKAKHYLKLNKQIQPELTIENFQQLVYLLALILSSITYGCSRTDLAHREGGSTITALSRGSRTKISFRDQSKSNDIV